MEKGVLYLYLYLAKPLSALCCVKKLNSNTYGDWFWCTEIFYY